MPSRPPPSSPGRLVLVHSAAPDALFRHAAAPFCTRGRIEHPPPLLAVRQGGIRDELLDRAERAGCAASVDVPVVVFAELPALLAGPLAPLTRLERRALLDDLLARAPLGALGGVRASRHVRDAIDALFGDLVAERIEPELLTRARTPDEDAWSTLRDEDLRALYTAYRDAVAALPAIDGVARSDGRDGPTLAADAIRADPDGVRARVRRALADVDESVSVAIYGLNDLRGGWDYLLDALRDAPFVDEVRVYVALGEHELLDQLLAKRPDAIVRAECDAGGHAAGSEEWNASTPPSVRAVAAPDLAREVDVVARRVKRLIVDDGADPQAIAVVSRKSRPYGPRMVDALRRHGVPVSARMRTNLAEVSVVAALLRVFRAADDGYPWRTLAELAESSYFDLALDVGLLRRASGRGRLRSLDAWSAALQDLVAEAVHARQRSDDDGPDLARAQRAAERFAAFRAVAADLATARTRSEWIALALRCIGRAHAGERADGAHEGLWGLRRNACRPPHDDTDALLVDATRRDVEALDALGGLLGDWRDALSMREGAGDERLSAPRWHRELVDALADVEITPSTPQRRGVQMLEASAAVWRTFDHVFVVGLSAGDFPAEPAPGALFAEHEREARYAIGLPLEPVSVWFAREASLLRMLVGGARRSLHVSYAYADANGSAQIPSADFDDIVSRATQRDGREAPPFQIETIAGSQVVPASIDDVWCADDLLLYAARTSNGDALAHLASDGERRALLQRVLVAAATEHDRRALRLDRPARRADAARPWNGRIESEDLVAWLAERFGDRTWSASQLEAYGRCPFTFFARHVLDLRSVEEPDEEMDGATRGALVHVCLDRLHAGLASDLGDAALTTSAWPRATTLIPTIVRRALDEFEKIGRGGVPAMRVVRERELQAVLEAYLQWEIAENEKTARAATPQRRPLVTELAFGVGDAPAVTLHHAGRTLRLRGKIDRVDEIIDGARPGKRYVVDHKTSAASVEPVGLYEHGGILQLPLYMLALARMSEGAAGVWGGAYQIVKDGGARTAALHPEAVKKDGRPTAAAEQSVDRRDGALEHAFYHIDGITAGTFPARIPECSKACPTFCDMKDVCREDRVAKGGPRR